MDQVHVGEDLFLHIVVAVSGDGGGGARAVLGVDGVGAAVEQGLAGLEAVAVVVADDIVELGLRHVAGHGVEVEEALIAVSLFRYLVRGEHGVEDHGHGGGVDHHILGAAGVDAYAAEGDIAGGGVEVFILDLAQRAAVHGVAVVAGQLRHVQTIHAAADLLVGGEYHADLAVGAALQQLHGSHDLGDAGLVVGAQQGGAIGDDQLLAGVGGQARAQGLRQGDGVGQVLACATNADALGTNAFDLSSLNELTDGVSQLNDAMNQLMDGAAQLVDGASQLANGTLALLDGASQLNSGASALDDGLGQLTNGLDTLSSNNAALQAGAQQVADGVLASANSTLMEGGLIDTPMTWDNYASVIDEVLTMNEKTLAAARKKMVRTVWEQEPSFKDSQLDIALYLSATKTNHDLEAALRLMQSYDPSMFSAMLDLSTASAKQTVHDELKYQAENSQDIADVRALKNSLAQIQYFVSSVNQYTNGVATAADGAHSAKDGAAQLADGTKTLYDGVTTLNDGAGQLSDGTVRLNDGLNQFNEEGISKLTGALDEEQIHGLKTVLDEMTSRLEDYTSFAGKSEDASGSVKFVYKTGETVAAADVTAQTTADVQEGNFFTRLWQRIVNLFKF